MHFLCITLLGLTITFFLIIILWKRKIASLKQYSIDHIAEFIPDRFKVETFNVTTDDGYTLQLFNVRSKTKFNPKLNPVLFQHGLGSSAARYLVLGERSAAYIMADLGCDVYLSNNRGTVYSLKHKTHSIKSREFWDYSFQDLTLDQKANLEFIFDRTGGKKIHYLGHSQGATQMIAGLADDDRELADSLSSKIEMFHALAPVIYSKGAQMLGLKVSKYTWWLVLWLDRKINLCGAGFTPEKINHSAIKFWNKMKWFNKTFFWSMTDASNEMNYWENAGVVRAIHPHGNSIKCLTHFIQCHNREGTEDYFCKFDYGEKENMIHYGQRQPPTYNLSLIHTKTKIYYGTHDKYLNRKSMEKLAMKLPNANVTQ